MVETSDAHVIMDRETGEVGKIMAVYPEDVVEIVKALRELADELEHAGHARMN